MHHVIQEDLFSEFNFKMLYGALRDGQYDHTLVKVVPFTHELIPDVTATGKITTWGSTALGQVADERGWTPGRYMNANFDMRVLKEKYGEHLMNVDGYFTTLAGVPAFTGLRFVRPCLDNKAFTGIVRDGEEFDYWRTGLYANVTGFNLVNAEPNTPVMVADPKFIQLETRFFVVGGQVITGSTYKAMHRPTIYQRINENAAIYAPVLEFARKMVKLWEPIEAYVLDIGLVDGEPKVIEINCINHSGFYMCDMPAVLRAIEIINA